MPKFAYPIVQKLYEHDFWIDPAILEEIISLGEAVLPDLQAVLIDAMDNYEQYADAEEVHNDTHNFVAHALYLLGFMKAETAFPLIRQFFSQPLEVIFFWLPQLAIAQDVATICLTNCGHAHIEEIMRMFREVEQDNILVQTSLINSLALIGYQHEQSRPAIVNFFVDLLDDPQQLLRSRRPKIISMLPGDKQQEKNLKKHLPEILGLYADAMLLMGECLKQTPLLEKIQQLMREGKIDEAYLDAERIEQPDDFLYFPTNINEHYVRLRQILMEEFGEELEELGFLEETLAEEPELDYLPPLTHIEQLRWMYCSLMPESPEYLQEVFESGEALLPDLKLMVQHFIEHEAEYAPAWDHPNGAYFLQHAFLFLRALKATDSFPLLLELLRKEAEVLKQAIEAGYFTNVNYSYVAEAGRHYKEEIEELLFDPLVSDYAKDNLLIGMLQMGLRFESERLWVASLLEKLIQHSLKRLQRQEEDKEDMPLVDFVVNQVYVYLHFSGGKYPAWLREAWHKSPELSQYEDVRIGLPVQPDYVPETIVDCYQLLFANFMEEMKEGLEMLERMGIEEIDELEAFLEKEDELNNGHAAALPREGLPAGSPIADGGTHFRAAPKVGRNDPCPCGSGKKYKKCCGR